MNINETTKGIFGINEYCIYFYVSNTSDSLSSNETKTIIARDFFKFLEKKNIGYNIFYVDSINMNFHNFMVTEYTNDDIRDLFPFNTLNRLDNLVKLSLHLIVSDSKIRSTFTPKSTICYIYWTPKNGFFKTR